MQLLKEINYYLVSIFYLSFTDFNPNAEAKLLIGWVIVLLCITNLVWPNGYVMFRDIIPELLKNCRKKR